MRHGLFYLPSLVGGISCAFTAIVLTGCVAKEARPKEMTITAESVVVRVFSGADPSAGAKTAAWVVQALQRLGHSATLIDANAATPGSARYLIEGDVVELELGLPTTLAVHARMMDNQLKLVLFDGLERRSSKQPRGDDARILLLAEEIGTNLARIFSASRFAPVASGVPEMKPHMRKILVTDGAPSAEDYVFIKQIEAGKGFYGSGKQARDAIAQLARDLGADAIVETKVWFRVTGLAWAAPAASGKAVLMKDPCSPVWASLGGDYFPREDDTEANIPRTRKCAAFSAAPPTAVAPRVAAPALPPMEMKTAVPAPAPVQKSGDCSTDQILSMKNTGLTDAQIRAACAR